MPEIYSLLLDRYHLKPEECVAFGDYLNDYEMLTFQYLMLNQSKL